VTARLSTDPWTPERIRAYGVRMPGVKACEAVYGVSANKAYEMLAAGNVDFPVIRRGHRYWVPTAAVLALLGFPSATDVKCGTAPASLRLLASQIFPTRSPTDP
jgi:hypothetical protein